ncbi:hypothetical protein PVAND_004580 [Polypedilum vanderplanki]|uniref:FERM domain-containing protein n=1 Tax=Polypedilum vanderplanki TaxID=319348 RepID=A0A9J6BY03_POLVA|nr:hypothetical protein PVAND_004580 [Polypedilum vanderplanki]
MRAFCTVSAPLEVCAPPSRPPLPLPPLPANARFLALKLFGTPQSRTLYFLVEAKSRVREVYAQTCHHFSKQGMLDTELFGLAVLIDGEYLFADPESKLSKYGPKSWRSSHTHGLDANGKPLLEFHFRVQFYIESPLMLRDEITRHHYYLQLKTNAVGREIPKDCSDQSLLLLGGLALQADLGDCPDDQSTTAAGSSSTATSSTDYFRADDYIPSTLRTTWGISALHSCHRENRGMSRADAETHFIREACGLHEAINAHIFRMKSNKSENGVGSVMLIIYAKGLKIVNETSPPVTFLWPSISKLSFDRKKFELRSGENKITLYSSNDDKNKMLLALCRETHQFSMKIAPRLTEAMKREEEESNCIHACYLYSRALNMQYKSKNDQRISVISSTSSNTTSGIVSDRVHSEDELEILINTPPIAAPSTESLALAHLLDCPSVSRQTSSVGQVSLKDIGDTFAALSIRSNTRSTSSEGTETLKEKTSEKDCDVSPSSQHNVGSQCSSTCSTVVVVNSQQSQFNGSNRSSERRQSSTCSSLELGFSHTAQNSAVSESTNNDNHHYGTTDTQNDDEETISGVYALDNNAPTETSGVYTMNSSEMTGESSEIAESESHESSHYGSFHPNSEMGDKLVVNINIDSVDGDFRQRLDSEVGRFRMRSDSNISAAGSFRGDGSDPTDKKHNPLTAEELTDLIVGRGTYPSRKTVSDTMDSDCDYVTLPIPLEGESYLQGSEDTAPTEDEYEKDLLEVTPPAPPQRIDSMSLSNIVEMPQPPPYNSHHETTGLRGPDISSPELASIPLRDSQIYPRKSLRSLSTIIPPTTIPEETPARFITTRPHINILKAHTTLVGEKPSYAAPTVNTINNLSQSPLPTATSLGIPYVPYHNLHATHKTHLSHSQSASAPRTCVLLPVIKPRTQSYVPPPMQTHRQPPPPPPTQPQLATVYTSQLARSQIELYQQQLYSDVDYVIYPLQDPAVSQQEYLDSKQGSILAAMAQTQPPPYLAYHTVRAHNRSWDGNPAIYRSTPFLSMAISSPSRYASTQNLSDTYVQLPGTYSPLYSPSVASLCSSYEPPPPLPPLRPPRITQKATSTLSTPTKLFSRSRSDDNILNSIDDTPQSKRRPIPIPPAYEKKPIRKPPMPAPIESCLELASTPPSVPAKPSTLKTSSSSSSMKLQSKSSTNLTTCVDTPKMATSTSQSTTTPAKPFDLKLSHVICPESNRIIAPVSLQQQLDISILREKSRNLDLPLISALCNDRSLLKQTKAFVQPKQQRSSLQNNSSSTLSSKSKYPVSGLSTTQLSSTTKSRKTTISHRHPQDKLPPLPVSNNNSAVKNNYVMDPIPLKQKTNQQNTNL